LHLSCCVMLFVCNGSRSPSLSSMMSDVVSSDGDAQDF